MSERWLYGWALGYAAVGAASLLVPLYALALGGGAFLVGLLAATAAFAGVPGAVLWGRLAARTHRRRPFVLVALGLLAAVLAVVPLVRSPYLLVVVNAALWFVVAAAAPVLNLIVVDGHPESSWAKRIGRLNAYQGYGWVGGMVVGTVWTAVAPGYLDAVAAQRLLLWALALAAAAGFALVRAWYPEPSTVSEARFRRAFRRFAGGLGAGRYLRTLPYGPSRLYWSLSAFRAGRFPSGPLWRYLLAATLFYVGFSVFWGPMPAFLVEEGFASGTVFVLFLVANLGSAVTYDRVAALTERVDAGTAQAGALGVRVVLFPAVPLLAALAVGPALAGLGVDFALNGVTWAVVAVTATTLVTRLAPEHGRSEALGAYTALAGVGNGVGAALGGALAREVGYLAAFGVAAALVLAGGVLVLATADTALATADTA